VLWCYCKLHFYAASAAHVQPDLIGATNVRENRPEWQLWERTHGHKPGVRLGERLAGRGHLSALGIHQNYYAGIEAK
jgi:hypothetical protein